jgi:hypothetical protein
LLFYFFNLEKQANFWNMAMAMALGDKLAAKH